MNLHVAHICKGTVHIGINTNTEELSFKSTGKVSL